MRRAGVIFGTTIALSIAVLALLLAAFSVYLDRPDALLFYGAVTLVATLVVAILLRGERRARRAAEASLPPELRPARRVPRQPIRFPLGGGIVTFFAWYAMAVAAGYLIDGALYFFDFAVVAPFAAFMLTIFTFAGRHIAFRLTAEEAEEAER